MKNKTINELFDDFIKQCQYVTKMSEASISGFKSTFDLLLRIYPGLDLKKINSDLMSDFFEKLENRARIVGRNKQVKIGIKNSTVATYRSKLNKFFIWLVANGYLKTNPFDTIPYPNVNYDDKQFLRKEELEKIAAAIHASTNNLFVRKRNIAIFYTLLYCGLRRGELVGLKLYNADLDKKELTVTAETSKSKISRIIPMNIELVSYLKDYLMERKKYNYKTQYLFVSANNDDRISFSGLKHITDNLIKISGVKFHLHQFRHSFAVNMLNNKSDIAKLKQLMGHRDIRMTASYLRCLPTESMREDVESLRLNRMCWKFSNTDSEDAYPSERASVRQKRLNRSS